MQTYVLTIKFLLFEYDFGQDYFWETTGYGILGKLTFILKLFQKCLIIKQNVYKTLVFHASLTGIFYK